MPANSLVYLVFSSSRCLKSFVWCLHLLLRGPHPFFILHVPPFTSSSVLSAFGVVLATLLRALVLMSTWAVTGGGEGGILVRTGRDIASAQAGRLSTGAIVSQVALEGNRLCYELLTGGGPATGWVSIRVKDKDLLVRVPSERPKATVDSLLTLAAVRARGPAPDTWWDKYGGTGGQPIVCDSAASPLACGPQTGLLPLAPRGNTKALPTIFDLPEKIQDKFAFRRKKPYARMFCFYGIGDSAGQWMNFVDTGPSWCEIIVYECRAHGLRADEPWDRTYEERAEDAWEQLLPAFSQHARGGIVQGAPFALYCHSGGVVPLCLLAQRLRVELGLEPTVVYVADQRPPNMPFLNDRGLGRRRQERWSFAHVQRDLMGTSSPCCPSMSCNVQRRNVCQIICTKTLQFCTSSGRARLLPLP